MCNDLCDRVRVEGFLYRMNCLGWIGLDLDWVVWGGLFVMD